MSLKIVTQSEFKGEDLNTGRPLFTVAVGRCECGRTVNLVSDYNRCGCGRDYMKSGSEWA